MVEKSRFASKTFLNVTFGISAGGIFVLAVIFSILNNNIQADIEGIKTGDVYAKSITYDKLGDDVFTTVEITLEDGTETTAKIISGDVSDGLLGGEIELVLDDGTTIIAEVDGYTPELEIEDGSITEAKLAEAVITKLNADPDCEFELEDGSVITVKLADYAVTSDKLATGSVTTLKLLNGSITSGKLQDGIVLTKHLGNSSVTTIKIADDSITTVKILDNVINSAKIADGSIENIDVSATADISWTKVSKLGSSLADLTTRDAADVDIADAGGYFAATEVEGALQELGLFDTTINDLYVNEVGDTMTGALIITPSVDGGSILNVTTSGGASVLNVDTTSQLVGIGTAAPNNKLEVVGGHFLLQGDRPILRVETTNRKRVRFTFKAENADRWHLGNDVIDGNVAHDFSIYNAPRTDHDLFIAYSTGYVGIGTTGPSMPLHIGDGTQTTRRIRIDGALASTHGVEWYTGAVLKVAIFSQPSASSSLNHLDFYTGSTFVTPKVRIQGDGSVGIGTIVPQELLHVSSGTTTRLEVESTAANAAALKLTDTSGSYGILTGGASDQLRIYDYSDTAYRLTMDGDGKFLIGSGTSPGAMLQVEEGVRLAYQAGHNVTLFENATSGENPLLYLYGWDTVAGSKKYAHFQVSTSGNAVFTAEDDMLLSADKIYIGNYTAATDINYYAKGPVYLFRGSASGENNPLLIYGYDTGAVGVKYGRLNVDAAGDFNIEAQTGEVIRFRTGGGDKVTIDNTGQVGIGIAGPSHPLHVSVTDSVAGSPFTASNASLIVDSGSTGSNSKNSFYGHLTLSGSTAHVAVSSGVHGYVLSNATVAVTDIRGGNFMAQPNNQSAGNVTNAYGQYSQVAVSNLGSANQVNAATGLYGSVRTANSKGRVAVAYGGRFALASNTGGQIDSGYGLYVVSPVTIGAFTNNYGLYLEDQSGASALNYAIYTNAGDVLLNAGGDANTDFQVNASGVTGALFVDGTDGEVGIGTNNPAAKLQVHVAGPSNSGIRMISSLGAELVDFQENGNNAGSLSMYDQNTNEAFRFRSEGDSWLNPTGGDVGIGTITPDFALQVNGTIAPETSAQDLGTAALRWDAFLAAVDANTLTMNGDLVLYKAAAAPSCGAGNEGSIIYNDTSDYPCYCDATSWKKVSDDTSCF